ncbi:MAG: UDP-N-acetylglucosamine--N-acetylmuramyl-(pentapeptide) pyrophosphoryl-undecaprenol N-acetylglucosamine transferase, partial [Kiritimatiellae bacterium]|nr:UDP-N-acetylglucosamine--N-acetylmuramyl-(pentapeptide) pyrophosphoryl-undecaprenol N-acetylglucosamine transferase [Kiritimatiellia bacterium]
MKIAVACGGTGGHIFPGLATAQVLRDAGHEVTLWMAGKAVEATAMAHWTGPVQQIRAEGLPSGLSLKSFRAALTLVRAVLECRRRMGASPPDVLLAMGSYASVGPVLAAASLKIPVVLHEANVIPGKAIHWLSRWATAVGTGFAETAKHLKHPRLVLTGMPLRKEIEAVRSAHYPDDLDRHLFTFLVMGGSGGAHRLNELASEAFVLLHGSGRLFQVIHLTGPADETV